ncbi:MAG: CheR family methyltransferase [Cyclobacteriaceae bacterium]|jgi:two-component system CheB/CheR fusion protein
MDGSPASENDPTPQDVLTIVGIGASAGGLAALKTFFAHVPENSGLSFVIVVHLSPEHESHMADLLQPHINMPVQQVLDTVPLEANHVYIIPPGCNLNSIDTHLRLSELEKDRIARAPIDHFFRTLASTHDGNSVGVILTGTGSDGTLGIKEVKGMGGLTIVQNPNEAEFDGMPQSALATGEVDLVLPLAKMPDYIIRFSQTKPRITVPAHEESLEEQEQQLLLKALARIRAGSGRDFSLYKPSTIMRRLRRRMQLFQVEEFNDYLNILRNEPVEVKALSEDFLITVTNFFRDPKVFEELANKVIPLLFAVKNLDEKVRVWSVGCATGEEAYSLAMLLLEEVDKTDAPPEIQIFATDLHDHSLQQAREGFYPGDIETDVSAERLQRFFVKESGGYRIRKEVRDKVIFAPHNLLSDPPFSKIDLIVCRNLLIYLQREVQRDVIELFHYALEPEGVLLLGSAETIESSELFRVEHKGLCLFRKRNVPVPEPRLPVFPLMQSPGVVLEERQFDREPMAYGALHQRTVEQFVPPSLLVSPDYKLVHISEHAGRFLVHPGGEVTSNVFKLVRPDFHIELRTALHKAKEKQQLVRSKPMTIRLEGELREVILSVFPAKEAQQEGFFVVIFDERELLETNQKPSGKAGNHLSDAESSRGKAATGAAGEDEKLRELESELDLTRQRMKAIIEEYERGQEQMRASNEEMQSANEELRSAMEELETSREELQSMNEELVTLNQENRHKVEELSQLSSDLQNFLTATHIATIFLDRQFRILRFTPQVSELFHVRLTDRGRPLFEITHRLGYQNLQQDARQVLNKLVPIEREVQNEQGKWYLMRVLPYRSTDDHIEGVVITFVDITSRKQSEEAMRESAEQYRALIEASAQMVWTTDATGKVIEDSATWRAFTGQTFQDWKGDGWLKAVHPDDLPQIRSEWQQAVRTESGFEATLRMHHQSGKWRWATMRAVPLKNADDILRGWVGMNTDVTERIEAEEALRKSEEHLRLIMESAIDFVIFTMDLDRKVTAWNAGAERITGYTKEVMLGELADLLFVPEDRETEPALEMNAVKVKGHAESKGWHLRKDGRRFWGSGYVMPLLQENGQVRGYLKIITDSTGQMQMSNSLWEAKEAAERAANAKEEFLAHMSHEIRTPLNAVVGLSGLLLKQHPREDQLENLETLKFSAESLKMLVNDILDFSKIQAGKVMVEETNIRLKDLLYSLKKAHQNWAEEQGTSLQFQVDELIPEVVRTDSLKLSQVLNNLLSNALKFTKAGAVVVNVSLDQQDKGGEVRWIKFSVSDTGVGIPADKLETIFDTFTQADVSTVRNYGGTGLGLSITKLLLELMGSQINVESEVGKGASFYFTVPMRQGSANVVSAEEWEQPPGMQAQLLTLKVLMVEDAHTNRMMLRQLLKKWWQLVPDEAEDGRQALDMVRQKQYDIILLDVRMPVMDGYQAARAMRALPNYVQIPILALTADTVQEVEKHPEAALFTDVLIKPLDSADLQEKILRYTVIREMANAKVPQVAPLPEREPAQAASSPLDLRKLEVAFSGNAQMMQDFLVNALKEFTTLQQTVPEALIKRDADTLRNYAHKLVPLLDALNLTAFSEALNEGHALVQEKATNKQLKVGQQKVDHLMTQINTAIRQYLNENHPEAYRGSPHT